MKYIDADKLIAKIQPLYEKAKDNSRFSDTSSDYAKWSKAEWVYKHVLHLITSLQQEQPEKILTFGGFVDKVGAWFDNLRLNKFRKIFAGEIFPATELVQEYDLFVQELSKLYSDNQKMLDADIKKKEINEQAYCMPMNEFTHESEAKDFYEWVGKEFMQFYSHVFKNTERRIRYE